MKAKKELNAKTPKKEFKELTDDQLQKVNGGVGGPQNMFGDVPPNYGGNNQIGGLDLGGHVLDKNFPS